MKDYVTRGCSYDFYHTLHIVLDIILLHTVYIYSIRLYTHPILSSVKLCSPLRVVDILNGRIRGCIGEHSERLGSIR